MSLLYKYLLLGHISCASPSSHLPCPQPIAMVNWSSMEEIQKDAGIPSAYPSWQLFMSYIVVFDRFMHALLGVYMYIWIIYTEFLFMLMYCQMGVVHVSSFWLEVHIRQEEVSLANGQSIWSSGRPLYELLLTFISGLLFPEPLLSLICTRRHVSHNFVFPSFSYWQEYSAISLNVTTSVYPPPGSSSRLN